MSDIEIWTPCESVLSSYKQEKYAIVILNTELKFAKDVLLGLWNHAQVRITVDGGTSRWLSWLHSQNLSLPEVPHQHLITGDMDSLSPQVLEKFLEHYDDRCQVVETPDQNETDFTKCLRELNTYTTSNNITVDNIFVLAETSGRLDQILAIVNTLYKADAIVEGKKIFLLASNSLTWLLAAGSHVVSIPKALRQRKSWCALIPLNEPPTVSTTGLKWNLNNTRMAFGGMVSTSNTYDATSECVTVNTDKKIVWTMGIKALFLKDT